MTLLILSEMLKRSRGRYTPKQVERCAQLGGAFGKEIDRLFTNSGIGDFMTRDTKVHKIPYEEDVQHFVREFQDDALLDYLPGREHKGFENFLYSTKILSPQTLGRKLHALSKTLDKWRRITGD